MWAVINPDLSWKTVVSASNTSYFAYTTHETFLYKNGLLFPRTLLLPTMVQASRHALSATDAWYLLNELSLLLKISKKIQGFVVTYESWFYMYMHMYFKMPTSEKSLFSIVKIPNHLIKEKLLSLKWNPEPELSQGDKIQIFLFLISRISICIYMQRINKIQNPSTTRVYIYISSH